MKLIPATVQHINDLMPWFTCEQQVAIWAGPNFSFPFSKESFLRMIKWQELASFSLVNNSGELIAFGQFYQRLDCCHLGRLVVNPLMRGQGIGKTLVNELSRKGMENLKLAKLSLFVLADNKAALNLYLSLGFNLQTYPDNVGLENCLYLVKTPE